jgi:citronellol/citronellal dehydrogenase
MGYRSIFRDGLFAGRHVIVTGGGSGIGRCTAHELAALGAPVAETQIGNRVALAAALAEGKGILEAAPGSRAAREIMALAREVLLRLARRDAA